MNTLARALSAFNGVDAAAFTGLPDELSLDDLEAFLTIDRDDLNRGLAGTPAVGRSWVAGESAGYGGGVRVWLDGESDRVVLVEGISPVGTVGSPFPAPELGAPDAVFDAVLGPVLVRDAERVYADRGLALHVFPETAAVIRVVAFAPTTVEDYRTRLQPQHEPLRKFPQGVVR